MTGYISGVILYLVIGYILSLVVGFRTNQGEMQYMLLTMMIWPVILLLVVTWIIEDTLMYLHEKKR